MFPKPVSAHLLSDESIDLPARLIAEDDIIQSMRRVAQFNQIRKISTRRGERNGYCLSSPGMSPRLLHGVSHPFCYGSMALPRLCRRNLQCYREKSLVIAVGAALQHRKDLFRARHGLRTTCHICSSSITQYP